MSDKMVGPIRVPSDMLVRGSFLPANGKKPRIIIELEEYDETFAYVQLKVLGHSSVELSLQMLGAAGETILNMTRDPEVTRPLTEEENGKPD